MERHFELADGMIDPCIAGLVQDKLNLLNGTALNIPVSEVLTLLPKLGIVEGIPGPLYIGHHHAIADDTFGGSCHKGAYLDTFLSGISCGAGIGNIVVGNIQLIPLDLHASFGNFQSIKQTHIATLLP